MHEEAPPPDQRRPGLMVEPSGPADAPPERVPRQSQRRAPSARPRAVRALVPPALVMVLVAGFALLGLNGSSVGVLESARKKPADLVLGVPRDIRSDEYAIGTPNIVGNVRRGLPARTQIGLSQVFLPASNVLAPSRHWTEAFKPYDWMLLAGAPLSQAFAARWWLLVGIGLLGVYALLLLLTESVAVAAGLSVVTVLPPSTAWWSNQPAPILGALAAATACLLLALRAERTRTAVLWGVGAGYSGIVATLLLYPPWLLSVGIVCGALVIGAAFDRLAAWRRLAAGLAGAAAVFVPSMLLWYLQARPAIEATSRTIYPGHRRSVSGGANLAWLFDAPSSPMLSLVRHVHVVAPGTSASGETLFPNLSEVSSSWMPAPLALAALLLAVRAWQHLRRDGDGSSRPGGPSPVAVPLWSLVSVSVATAVLYAWALLPLPDLLGRLTLLDRVPGRRTIVATGLGTVLTVALGYRVASRFRSSRLVLALTAGAGVLWLAMMVRSLASVTSEPRPGVPQVLLALLVAVAMAGTVTAVLLGRRWGRAALAAAFVSLLVYAPVNPLSQGLGPLQHDPLFRVLRTTVGGVAQPKAMVFGGGTTNALVTASGVENMSGVTPYPDRDLWTRWAPDQEEYWNIYAQYNWEADPTLGDKPVIERLQGTLEQLRVNPCSAMVRELGVDVAVSEKRLDAPCLSDERTAKHSAGGRLYVYRVTTH